MSNFITNGASVLPVVKTDARQPSGATTEWTAEDSNDIRQALLDVRANALNVQSGFVNPNLATITSPGSSTPRSLASRFGDIVNVLDFGADPTGIADSTSAIQAALNQAVANGGGTVFAPSGTYLIAGVLQPQYSGTPPVQVPLRITGTGCHYSSLTGGPPNVPAAGSTIFNMTSAATYGKLLTLGLGYLEITGIVFKDTAGTSAPWIYTTNTTLNIHDCSFFGSKTWTNCNQDCIVLGGTVEAFGDDNPTHGFQGYGTVIERNYFDKIRRVAWLRTYCNGISIKSNTVWADCGSNLANGACIDLMGSSAGGGAGANYIVGNTIEVPGYPYAFSCVYAQSNVFIGNGLYDNTGTTLGMIYYGTGAASNLLIGNSHPYPTPSSNIAGSFSYNTAIFDSEPLKIGFNLLGSQSNPLSLYAGVSSDCVYMDLYPRSASPSTRGGYVGFPAAAGTSLYLTSDLGDVWLNAKAGNRILTTSPFTQKDSAQTPGVGAFTIDPQAADIHYVVLNSAGGTWSVTTANNGFEAHRLSVIVKNSSGGAVTLTWGNNFRLGSAWSNPANGYNRAITFIRDYQTANYIEVSRSSADVLNT